MAMAYRTRRKTRALSNAAIRERLAVNPQVPLEQEVKQHRIALAHLFEMRADALIQPTPFDNRIDRRTAGTRRSNG